MIDIIIMIDERDPWSGYTEKRSRTFQIPVSEAEALVRSIQRQIPEARKRQKKKNKRRSLPCRTNCGI